MLPHALSSPAERRNRFRGQPINAFDVFSQGFWPLFLVQIGFELSVASTH